MEYSCKPVCETPLQIHGLLTDSVVLLPMSHFYRISQFPFQPKAHKHKFSFDVPIVSQIAFVLTQYCTTQHKFPFSPIGLRIDEQQ